jgi:hypothetical protein
VLTEEEDVLLLQPASKAIAATGRDNIRTRGLGIEFTNLSES